jgi:hypothetical protein
MRKGFLLLLFCLAAVGARPGAGAAQTGEAGCVDAHGVPVGLLMDSAIKDLAVATTIDGRPMIIMSPTLEWVVPRPTGLFVFAHECGHQALGHVLKGASLDREQEADCWAINLIYRSALIDDAGLRIIERDLARYGVGDATHLPGPERAVTLGDCLRPDSRWAQPRAAENRAAPFIGKADLFVEHASGLSGAAAMGER